MNTNNIMKMSWYYLYMFQKNLLDSKEKIEIWKLKIGVLLKNGCKSIQLILIILKKILTIKKVLNNKPSYFDHLKSCH